MKKHVLNAGLLWQPHITVAMVIEQQGKFLIVEENVDGKIVYNQPAGHWETHETLAAAAARETLEETGWEVIPKKIVGIYLYTSHDNGITYLRVCFTGTRLQQKPHHITDPDIIRHLWLTREELIINTQKLRSPMVLQCIEDYRTGQNFPLNLITDLRYL